jgi:hydrogenase-1 operon protein HyaF
MSSPENPDFAPRGNPMRFENEEKMTAIFLETEPAEQLNLIGMPSALQRKMNNRLVTGDHKASPAMRVFLDKLAEAIRAYKPGERPIGLPLRGFTSEDLEILGDLLGDGEVSVVAGHDPLYQVQEANMAGVWRVRATDSAGNAVLDIVEVGDVPSLVRAAVASLPTTMPPMPEAIAAGVMNAPAVLTEIAERASRWRPGLRNHVVNFTLMPMTEDDNALLTKVLGQAPLTIVSSGYGTCRVLMTSIRHVWAVQYLNAMGNTILDTIEVGDVPESVLAAKEDFEDSAQRLQDMVEAYL